MNSPGSARLGILGQEGYLPPMKTIKPLTASLVLLTLTILASQSQAQSSEHFRAMNQPEEAFRILGNLYYVGANSVAAYLITTPEGHILIDGGFEETVPMIRKGVKELGFKMEDVKILLNSHAHFDHCGGLAALQEETGARFFASEEDAPLLERGGLGDDLLGDDATFPAISVDRRLKDGDTVELGGTKLTARVTGGHTRGCTSWVFDVEEGGETYKAVSICSLSVLEGMVFEGENPTYPGIADDFRSSFETLEAIPADVFLASHAGFFKLKEKRARQKEGEVTAFVDPKGYSEYIAGARKRFEEMLAAERAGASEEETSKE